MILTNCAACAAPLGFALGKKCSRCSTRYCGPACQTQHWKEGGHDKLCKRIKRAGGAEQYHAGNKYAEAVAVAADACTEDTKGQTCYICTQAVHWKPKEGLVRGCSCRGTAGFAHVSCLAEQAKILFEEAEYNNLGFAKWERWHTCGLCKQQYHGRVLCALGWASWETYVGRPETDQIRGMAMNMLGLGLTAAIHHADALSVREAHFSTMRRVGASEQTLLAAQGNLATTLAMLGRAEPALDMRRDVYSATLRLTGEEHIRTLSAAGNYAISLVCRDCFKEAKSLMRKTMPVAQRVLGESDELTLKLRLNYALALYRDDSAKLDDLREAENTIADSARTARRVLSGAHPILGGMDIALRESRAALSVRQASSRQST